MENNRIDIDVLVEEYNKRSSEKLKDEFLKSKIKIVPYVDYAKKMLLADSIINSCYYSGEKIQINSCNKYLLYIYALLKHWTNINIREKELMKQYDILDQNGLIEKILELISKKEISSFATILEMKENDFLTNKCNIEIALSNKIIEYSPRLFYGLNSLLEIITDKINNSDIEKYLNLLKKQR